MPAPQPTASNVALLDELKSAFEVAVLVTAADGEIDENEAGGLADTLEDLFGQQYNDNEVLDVIDAYVDALEEEGFDARLAQIVSRLPDPAARRDAFVLGAYAAFDGGEPTEAELSALGDISEAFGMSEEEANSLLAQVEQLITNDAIAQGAVVVA
jgi:hypothetical protein